jgi:hypothetical protein
MTRLLRAMALVSLAGAVAACDRKSDEQLEPAAPAASRPASDEQLEPAAPRAAAVDLDDPSACASCHPAIVAEWTSSMHAAAAPGADPIVSAMVALRTERDGPEVVKACAGCHTPRGQGGVTCAACHAVAAVAADGPPGAARLEAAAGSLLLGPHDVAAGATTAHATGAAPAHMKDGVSLCMACHDKLEGPHGLPLCTTGVEWREVKDAASCTSCHMPEIDGAATLGGTRSTHRSHRFLGSHVRWQEAGVEPLAPIELAGRFDGDTLEITVTNLSPHGFPTGFPGRFALLELVGLDAGGAEVWRNVSGDPMKEHPEAVFNKVFVDAEGAPTIGPWAEKLARDNRLTAGEARTLAVEVPAAVRAVRARMLLRLMAPPLAKRLGLADSPLAAPRPVAEARITR